MSRLARAADSSRRVLVTPEGIAMPVTLASRGSRLGALMIDLMIITSALIVLFVVLAFAKQGADAAMGVSDEAASSPAGQFLEIVAILAMFALRHGYFLMFELGPRGATPGKRLTGLRIAARDGKRLTTEMVLARNLLRDIELFLPIAAITAASFAGGVVSWTMALWLLVFALFPLFNQDRLRAGDLIAGTWVLEAPRSSLAAALSIGQAATTGTSQTTGVSYRFGEEELAIYGEYELQTLERVLRDDRPEALAAVQEAICRKIGWNPGGGDERAFLEAYYTQLRARLESWMRLGKRKADKFSG
ncbi:MAG: RDD family protein [Novosphingobium sp.]